MPDQEVLGERDLDDLVLGEEAGEAGEPDDREVAHRERQERDRQQLLQPAVVAHVDVVVHRVHDRAGAEEHVGLEEAVGHQVEDRERVAHHPEAGGEVHVADLAHGRPGERLLDVVLGAAEDRTPEQRDRTDDDHRGLCRRRQLEDEVGAGDQVDAGGHHRGGVDERRHGGRALHRVEKPGLERHLGGLAAGTEQEKYADPVERGLRRAAGAAADHAEAGGAEGDEHQEDRETHPHVTDAVDDERLLGRGRRRGLVLPEPDEEVRREAHALPAQEQAEVVLGQHQHQHRGDEEVEVAEEPAPARVVRHVADRVDVDQRPDARDQQEEHRRQRVVEQVHADVEPADIDPVVEVLGDLPVGVVPPEHAEEAEPG